MASYESPRDTLVSQTGSNTIPDMPSIGTRYLLRSAGVEVHVTLKRMKNLRLRVNPADATIQLSAPWFVARSEIEGFVDRNVGWIVDAQTKARLSVPERLVSGGRAQLWGEWLELVVAEGPRASARVEGRRIHITRPDGDEAAALRALHGLHRRELAPAVDRFLAVHSPYVGRGPSNVRLGQMRSRWGSCNQVTGRMSFNIALAERDEELLEYVVVHELAHLLEANHGPRFKAHLDQMLPDWRRRDAALKGRL